MTKRKGKQAPTQVVYLTYDYSLATEAVEVYEKSGREAQKWQKLLLTQIMGRNDEDLWTHTKFGYSLPL
ncbi:MAG: hypothetical protein Q4A67_02145 [Aerococcus sp.]|nr:hypothetical protein [Aerococcus sp.]